MWWVYNIGNALCRPGKGSLCVRNGLFIRNIAGPCFNILSHKTLIFRLTVASLLLVLMSSLPACACHRLSRSPLPGPDVRKKCIKHHTTQRHHPSIPSYLFHQLKAPQCLIHLRLRFCINVIFVRIVPTMELNMPWPLSMKGMGQSERRGVLAPLKNQPEGEETLFLLRIQ